MQATSPKKTWLHLLLPILVLLQACVEPIDIVTDEVAPSLIVDGMVTDQNRPDLNRVRLSYTGKFDSEEQVVTNPPVSGATVVVRRSDGRTMPLQETANGLYVLQETDYAAQAGLTYTIQIKLPDGREYESRPEMLKAAPPLGDVQYEYKTYTYVDRNSAGELIERESVGFEVNASVLDPPGRGNYYRWVTEGVMEYFTRVPEVLPIPSSMCWAFLGNINTRVVTLDDRLIDGNAFNQTVVVVPGDIPTKFLVKVRQYAITAEAHAFWRLIEQQQTSGGSIFDPPPASIKGNVFCKTNPSEQVFGYFSAAGLSEKSLLIPRQLHVPLPGPPYVLPFGDCRYLLLYPSVTDIKPPGF